MKKAQDFSRASLELPRELPDPDCQIAPSRAAAGPPRHDRNS
jgi:hypothetical protein